MNEQELSPDEAIRAMLAGEELVDRGFRMFRWDGEHFLYRCIGEFSWQYHPAEKGFKNLYRKREKKTRPMDTFQCLAWVNSPDSFGWLVSIKHAGDEFFGDWDIPQRFKYDGREEYAYACSVSYRRARLLPDKSGIDESTIQGFLMEVV